LATYRIHITVLTTKIAIDHYQSWTRVIFGPDPTHTNSVLNPTRPTFWSWICFRDPIRPGPRPVWQ